MVKARVITTDFYTALYFDNNLFVKYTDNQLISIEFFDFGKIYYNYPEVDFPDSFLDDIGHIFENYKSVFLEISKKVRNITH
jgi:hypothetical protein